MSATALRRRIVAYCSPRPTFAGHRYQPDRC